MRSTTAIDGVELGRKFPRVAHELLPKLSSYGLRLATGWHSGYLTERSVEAEWKAAADHVQLLETCGCQILVYGECGMMEGDSPWDEPLRRIVIGWRVDQLQVKAL